MGDRRDENGQREQGTAHGPATLMLPLLIAVTLLLSIAAAGPGPLPGDPAVARLLQRLPSPPGDDIARFADLIGGLAAIVGVGLGVVAVLAVRGLLAAAVLLLAVLLSRALNPLLKAVIDSPRPTPQLVRVTEEATGLGFPSGHAMGAALLWGTVAWLAQRLIARPGPRRLVQAVAVGLVLVTGFGRVYSGAHWPSDVVGGYLWAAVVVVALVLLMSPLVALGGRVRRWGGAVGAGPPERQR